MQGKREAPEAEHKKGNTWAFVHPCLLATSLTVLSSRTSRVPLPKGEYACTHLRYTQGDNTCGTWETFSSSRDGSVIKMSVWYNVPWQEVGMTPSGYLAWV